MRRPEPRCGVKIALVSLLIGALGAPLFHVAAAIIAPQGFSNLRGDRLLAAPIVLLIAWLWSATYTLAIGGIVWPLLHSKAWDGFVTYVSIAVLSAFGLSAMLSESLPRWDLLTMAVLNALAVRLAELRLRVAWGKGPETLGKQ